MQCSVDNYYGNIEPALIPLCCYDLEYGSYGSWCRYGTSALEDLDVGKFRTITFAIMGAMIYYFAFVMIMASAIPLAASPAITVGMYMFASVFKL